MSRWRRKRSLHLEVDAAGWALVGKDDAELARASAATIEQLANQLAALKIAEPIARPWLHVTVHERWVRSFVVAPPESTRSLAELDLCVQARFDTLFGADGMPWTFRAAWHPSREFVVTAMPTPLVATVQALCARNGWRLATMRAGWARALQTQAWPRQPQWWATGHGTTLTLLHTRAARIDQARAVKLPSAPSIASAQAMVDRERLRMLEDADPSQTALRWIEAAPGALGSVRTRSPRAELELLDFARRNGIWSQPFAARPWLAAFTAALVLVAGSIVALQWVEVSRDQARLQQRLAKLASRQAPVPVRAKPRDALTAAQLDAINAAVHRLNTPWPAILHAIEEAMPPEVALLSIEPDAARERVRGAALARDHTAMFGAMRRLGTTSPFVEARLLHHETDEKDPVRPLRFQFEASLASTAGPARGAR